MRRFKRKKKTIGIIRDDSETGDELNKNDYISSLPLDLIIEIIAKLPLKSIPELVFVSKRWSAIVRGKDLTDSFISRSSSRPSLLLTLGNHFIRGFHWCSQEDPSCGNRRTLIPRDPMFYFFTPVRGLICGEARSDDLWILDLARYDYVSPVVCNPSTGQFLTLPRGPRLRTNGRCPDTLTSFLGYDPVNDVYTVLCMTTPYDYGQVFVSQEHQVFTLGRKTWRRVRCKQPHCPATDSLCRDGVIYYGAWYDSHEERSLLMSFDLRSQDFGVTELPPGVNILHFRHTALVKYHETVALVDRSRTGDFDLWVLKDAKKHKWSKISVLLPLVEGNDAFKCKGTISTGELIFAPPWNAMPYFILYYDPKEKSVRRVDIKAIRTLFGPTECHLDHVEIPLFISR
ncbi:unnamed protein product [Thlaspi arvense]|uniref:F-box domain-containing protein n=1 Tax=Thlaspi arvense TaxID=13288 RepID=A0AAU9S2V1_THLAR|nr:unnamed protein product [Thlaspi arvense]